ncbi:MAG: apolipoprotein N-acyltransferase [Planctomycetes bacterium]|nr:apolipoprotein N-acyltransferase [Planctomycetota bacterium]
MAARATPPASHLQWPARVPLAVGTGVLVVLAFPLYGDRYHLDHLAWVALVPLFLAARGVGARRGWLLGWLAGMAVETAGFLWILYAIRTFTQLGPILSSFVFLAWVLYSSVPWAILGWALGRLRESRQVLGVLLLWIGVEHFYPRLFPWHLGGALYARPWLLQCADLLGASGLTLLVGMVSVAVYRVAVHRREGGRFPRIEVAAAGALVAAALAYGSVRLEQVKSIERSGPLLSAAIVQGFIDPREAADDRVDAELAAYLDRSERLLREEPLPDLLVWPEGVQPYPFLLPEALGDPWRLARSDREGGADACRRLQSLGVPLVAGGAAVEVARDGDRAVVRGRYNAAFYLRPGGETTIYCKNRLIPFGEKVPLLGLLPESWRESLGLIHVGNLSEGRENPICDVRGRRFRHLICYEAVLPAYVRRTSEGADFLVNITEDIWYGRTAHVPQHLSVLILRAVECRIPVVRATNVGPSGVVRLSGEFSSTGRSFQAEVSRHEFAPVSLRTLYARGGFLFPLLCLAAGALQQLLLGRRAGGKPGEGDPADGVRCGKGIA